MCLINGAQLFKEACMKYDECIGLAELAELMDKATIMDAIPIDWLRERASRMLDFGEGVERIIKEWQDEQ